MNDPLPFKDVNETGCPLDDAMSLDDLETAHLVCESCTRQCPRHEQLRGALLELANETEHQKRTVSRAVQANINNLIIPAIQQLRESMPPHQHGRIQDVIARLQNITDPGLDRLASCFNRLSPAEVRVCWLIMEQYSAKQIAARLHISPATVNRHRENIRRKLGLTNRKINLQRFLREHSGGGADLPSLPREEDDEGFERRIAA